MNVKLVIREPIERPQLAKVGSFEAKWPYYIVEHVVNRLK